MFHCISEEIYRWLSKNPWVKEESITDWLQFGLLSMSGLSERVRFIPLTRQEEAHIGADMEWWALTNEKDVLCAYRFLVQAKYLKANTNVRPSIVYKNRNGYQIDLLIKAAKIRSAMPLYLYYSCSRPVPQMQLQSFPYLDKQIVLWCENCVNGIYLASAESVKETYFNSTIQKVSDVDLLNGSLGLSVCDFIWNSQHALFDHNKGRAQPQQKFDDEKAAEIFSAIDRFYMSRETRDAPAGNWGIRHTGSAIPEYLYRLIYNSGDWKNGWFFAKSAKELETISSIAIFDFRAASNFAGPGEKKGPDTGNG